MSEKRYPKDLQDIFQATRADLEVQLAESENHVTSANAKSFDVVLSALADTHNLVGGFVTEKSAILEKSAKNGKMALENLNKSIQNISSLQAKMNGVDKSKDLLSFKQTLAKELEVEVGNCFRKNISALSFKWYSFPSTAVQVEREILKLKTTRKPILLFIEKLFPKQSQKTRQALDRKNARRV